MITNYFREGVKRILDFEDSFDVIAEGDDGNDVLSLYDQYLPDVVLMDINMPTKNGVDATAELLGKYPDAKVIMLSIHDDESYVTHALKTGALGYMLKEMDANAIVAAIKVVAKGGSYLHPKVTKNLVCRVPSLKRTRKQRQFPSNRNSPSIPFINKA